jgi:hypothetical protein
MAMAIEYPDIVSEYMDAGARYECDGVQVVPSLEPPRVPIGGYTLLVLLFQSGVDVPVDVIVEPAFPTTGRRRGSPMLETGERELGTRLEPAQVGTLYVPIRTTEAAREGQHEIELNIKVKGAAAADRVRPQGADGGFRSDLIDDVVGLDLGRVLGVPFTVTPTRKIRLAITIQGQADSAEEIPSMAAKFESLWTVEEAEAQARAFQEVDDSRVAITSGMLLEPLYVGLLVEGQHRFAQSAVPLRVGEAIALAKMLTYTARHFLEDPRLQDGLLVPIWELAQEYELPTGDPLWVLRNAGFGHLVRLSVALSFGLVARALGSQPWSLEERRGLIRLIAGRLEAEEKLPVEFIYIPLLAASTIIAHGVNVEGEDVGHSLRLLKKARAARSDVLDDPELAEASQIFDRLLEAALKRQGG